MYRLELAGISKQYPAVRANDGVNLRVKPGEIHAVLGENGAGKSTLMKIIYGAVKADEGEVREEDYKEAEEMDEALSDDPAYDPAVQAPKEAER